MSSNTVVRYVFLIVLDILGQAAWQSPTHSTRTPVASGSFGVPVCPDLDSARGNQASALVHGARRDPGRLGPAAPHQSMIEVVAVIVPLETETDVRLQKIARLRRLFPDRVSC